MKVKKTQPAAAAADKDPGGSKGDSASAPPAASAAAKPATSPATLRLRSHFYRQFDADYTRDVPAEGYGGWDVAEVDFDAGRTGLVLMHAWDCGTLEEAPGQWHCCDEVPRTYHVCRTVLPPLLAAIRATPLPLFHVVGGAGYFEQYAGWQKTLALAGADDPAAPQVIQDARSSAVKAFARDHAFPGRQNAIDMAKAPPVKFPQEAVPVGDEGIAKNSRQLFALCRQAGVNHLIYMGFNIDWCLLMSPGGMVDMWRHGIICSAIRQAVTAVENKETARRELCKEIGLWRVSVQGGFIFDDRDFIDGIAPLTKPEAKAEKAAQVAAPGRAAAPALADNVFAPPSPQATWVEAGGEVYGAKPDATGPIGGGAGSADAVTTGDYVVSDLGALLDALAKAQPGQTVFIAPDAEIDLTEQAFLGGGTCLTVPAGVTLAGGRGHAGSPGALLYSDAHHTVLISVPGPGSRVTGLRLRGPDGKRRLAFHHRVFVAGNDTDAARSEAYYKLPNSDGVRVQTGPFTADNCEISGFSHAGVYLMKGHGHHIHHCYIHHVQRMGLGYGVCHNFDAQSLVEYCLLQDNKHHIAGTGSPGQGYEARHNVVLPYTELHEHNGKIYGQDHIFDLHGGVDRLDGTNIAGKFLRIHHNTVIPGYLALCLRGAPQEQAEFHHNWLHANSPRVRGQFANYNAIYESPLPGECVAMTLAPEQTHVHHNAYGRPPHVQVGLD